MTLGELAEMANGEGWLGGGYSASPDPKLSCDLTVISCKGWTRNARWTAPIAPSPNLPTAAIVHLYPHLVLLEATIAQCGARHSSAVHKGGLPGIRAGPICFTPTPNAASRYPKHARPSLPRVQRAAAVGRLGRHKEPTTASNWKCSRASPSLDEYPCRRPKSLHRPAPIL